MKRLITSLGAGDPGGKKSLIPCKVPFKTELSLREATIFASCIHRDREKENYKSDYCLTNLFFCRSKLITKEILFESVS